MFDLADYVLSHEMYEQKVKDLRQLYGNAPKNTDQADQPKKPNLLKRVAAVLSIVLH